MQNEDSWVIFIDFLTSHEMPICDFASDENLIMDRMPIEFRNDDFFRVRLNFMKWLTWKRQLFNIFLCRVDKRQRENIISFLPKFSPSKSQTKWRTLGKVNKKLINFSLFLTSNVFLSKEKKALSYNCWWQSWVKTKKGKIARREK